MLAAGVGAYAAEPVKPGRDAGALYAQLCANCHGAQLEGAKAPSLRTDQLKHGRDDEAMLRGIRDGYPSNGMPAFAKTFSEAELRGMVAYLHEAATRAVDPHLQASHPLPTGTQHSEEHAYRIEAVAEGLLVPWSISFLPDGGILVTEREGRLRLIENGKLKPEPITGVPKVAVRDEAGLMSVVADPDFARDPWVYLSFSDPGDEEGTAMTKLIRARLRGNALVDQQTIFALPREQYQKSYVLFGSRLVFQGDYLFFSVGVRGMETDVSLHAQDLTVPMGKIHRVFRDGRIPPDNPFVDQPGAWPSIWARGVRNPQGLAVDPRTGHLWESEHGPRGGDELNVIKRGANYGWPLVTYGINYDGTPISDKTEAPGMEPPVKHWTPSIATSEIEFYTGDRFPQWKNNLFLGSLAEQTLYRFVIDNDQVTHEEILFKNIGRIRDIKTGPDGLIYIALERVGRPGAVIRLVPEADAP
ncbi:MAG: PQQ-dependent sugar dehydrogenase [Verrucomicrobia bacterium]|nr:PQQ-dependent sugar dehydrogenase [Verrucomicrobiota bacterium]